jgi:hypothetical protein
MPLTYQAFLNSMLASLGCDRICIETRTRLVQLTMSIWDFKFGTTTLAVEERYGSRLTEQMQEFVRRAIETMLDVHRLDGSFGKELWNYSEIAHDIEEQRDVENLSNNRHRRSHDPDPVVPLYAEA